MLICEKYPNVNIRKFNTNDQIRDDIYLQIKNNCWKESRNDADWVIVCDVDEFIYHNDLLSCLQQAKNKRVSHFKSVGYEMVGNNIPSPPESLLKSLKYGSRNISCDKTAVFDPSLIEEINYEWGGHTCLPIGKLKADEESIKLLHYKYFSLPYLIDRYKILGKRLSESNIKKKLGKHYLFTAGKIKKSYEHFLKTAERVIE